MNSEKTPVIDDGGPAFPATCSADGTPLVVAYPANQVSGMSLRDWFAGQALAGLMVDFANHPNSITTKLCHDYRALTLRPRQ